MAIKGNNIIIYRGNNAIAGTVSNEIQSGVDLIEISSPTSGQWKEYIAGRKSWSVNVNFLVLQNGDSLNLLSVGTNYTLTFRNRGSSYVGVTGTAMLKTCKITATKGNLVQGTFQFVGVSQLLGAGGGGS